MRWSEIQLAAYQSGKRQAMEIPERDHLKACLEYFEVHPKVAWCARMNTGQWTVEERVIRFGFAGLSDIIGQLKDGRFLAFECKRVGKLPTEHQAAFLALVTLSMGVAGYGQLDDAMLLMERA